MICRRSPSWGPPLFDGTQKPRPKERTRRAKSTRQKVLETWHNCYTSSSSPSWLTSSSLESYLSALLAPLGIYLSINQFSTQCFSFSAEQRQSSKPGRQFCPCSSSWAAIKTLVIFQSHWLANGYPYNGYLNSLYTWVVFYPLCNPTNWDLITDQL